MKVILICLICFVTLVTPIRWKFKSSLTEKHWTPIQRRQVLNPRALRHKNNHQRWIAWKPKRQVTSVTVTPHSTLGLNFNPSTSFNPSPKLEFNPDPTENSISTENSVEENLNSITTESFQNLKKKEFESSTLFEILNMTANLDDPNDQFAINNDDVFLLNEEEEDELSLQTEENSVNITTTEAAATELDLNTEENQSTLISNFGANIQNMDQCCACPGPTTTISIMSDNQQTDTTPLFEDTTTLTDLPRDGRQLNDEDQPSDETIGGSQPSTNNPLSAYFDRIRDIYELDLKILEQLADLLAGVDEEVLPALMTSLEPLLTLLMNQPVDNLDLPTILSYAAQTLQKSKIQVSLSSNLGDLDFVKIGPQNVDISQFVKPEDVKKILKMIMANYDQSGLRFPIQKLILGPRALKMFGSQENNRLVTHILSEKLYEYLSNTKISLEVNDGEAILDARMPPLSIVDRCDISLKTAPSYLIGKVKRTTHLKAGGEFGLFNSEDPTGAAIFNGNIDFGMSLKTTVSARLGKPFFNNCITKFNKVLPLSVYAHGNAYVSVKAVASNVRLERRFPQSKAQGRTINVDEVFPENASEDGLQPHLVFKIDFKLKAILKTVQIDSIRLKNCAIRFGGLKVFSYCGLIRKSVNSAVQQLAYDLNEIHAPRLLRQIENILRYRVGEEIAIPILLADRKGPLIRSLMDKANQVVSLKADLVSDLADLVESLN